MTFATSKSALARHEATHYNPPRGPYQNPDPEYSSDDEHLELNDRSEAPLRDNMELETAAAEEESDDDLPEIHMENAVTSQAASKSKPLILDSPITIRGPKGSPSFSFVLEESSFSPSSPPKQSFTCGSNVSSPYPSTNNGDNNKEKKDDRNNRREKRERPEWTRNMALGEGIEMATASNLNVIEDENPSKKQKKEHEEAMVKKSMAVKMQAGRKIEVQSRTCDLELHVNSPILPCKIGLSVYEGLKLTPQVGGLIEAITAAKEMIQTLSKNQGQLLLDSLTKKYVETTCCICLDEQPNMVLFACGHQCLHKQCLPNELLSCPLCRRHVDAKIQVDPSVSSNLMKSTTTTTIQEKEKRPEPDELPLDKPVSHDPISVNV